jgi:hypothetical protein
MTLPPGRARPFERARVGAWEATLELQSATAPWGGSVEGVMTIRCTDRAQRISGCEVRLMVPPAGSTANSMLPSGTSACGFRDLKPGERLDLPFSLKVGWGTFAFGPYGMTQGIVRTPGFLWNRQTVLALQVDIVPPPSFVQVAAAVSELTGLGLELWQVVSSGDGAAIALTSPMRNNPLRAAHLELFRGPDRDYGELLIDPRRGVPGAPAQRRRFSLRFPKDDPDEISAVVRRCLNPVLSRSEILPIPSTRPVTNGADLPRPAEANASDPETLPRPSAIDQ